jgi:hypothetical protein
VKAMVSVIKGGGGRRCSIGDVVRRLKNQKQFFFLNFPIPQRDFNPEDLLVSFWLQAFLLRNNNIST